MAGKNMSEQEYSFNGDRKLDSWMGREQELGLGMENCLLAVQLQHCWRTTSKTIWCQSTMPFVCFLQSLWCTTGRLKRERLWVPALIPKKEGKCGRWVLPAAAAFTLGTWEVPELCIRASGQECMTTLTAVGSKDGSHPLSIQADELCLGELPRSSSEAPYQSFKLSIPQVAINSEFLTNLKTWLLSTKSNEQSQQKGTVFPVHETLRNTETSQQQGCNILSSKAVLLSLFLQREVGLPKSSVKSWSLTLVNRVRSWGNYKLLQ